MGKRTAKTPIGAGIYGIGSSTARFLPILFSIIILLPFSFFSPPLFTLLFAFLIFSSSLYFFLIIIHSISLLLYFILISLILSFFLTFFIFLTSFHILPPPLLVCRSYVKGLDSQISINQDFPVYRIKIFSTS